MKFELTDLAPQGCEIEILMDEGPKKFRMKKFSLMAQLWITREWGSMEAWEKALDPQSTINVDQKQVPYLEALTKTVHYLLEDKAQFPTWESLAEAIGLGVTELLNLNRALMITIGVSQPLVEKAVGEAKKKMKAEVKRVGPK